MAEQQVVQQEITQCGSGGNVVNAVHPVIIMVPTPAQVKQKILYDKRFPKKIILTLSFIQILMALIGIISQVVGLISHNHYTAGAHYIGTGIWCGVFFGLSGFFGIIAGLKPKFSTIITFMVLSIIAAGFCLPLLVISSFGTTFSYYRCYRYTDYACVSHAMFAIQIIISLIQAIAAIASSVMSCRAVCDCCACSRQSEDAGVVYYSSTGGNGLNNMTTQQIGYSQSQPGYVTLPISQLQGAAAGATALPLLKGAENGDNPQTRPETPPPEYKSVAILEGKGHEENGTKYQRFQ